MEITLQRKLSASIKTMLKDFGDIAVKLSRNPLGVIGLLLVLVYGIAGYVTSSSFLEASDRSKLVWFIIWFPVLVLATFFRLVTAHFEKLYGPGDFADEQNFLAFVQQGFITRSELDAEGEEQARERLPIEHKILNTLWTKQVNRWPDMSKVWTFRMSSNFPQFLAFREASNRLIGEGLVRETNQGQIYLTHGGFDYCKQHYQEFPSDQWWLEETIKSDKLCETLNRR